jgi:YidC/Oxa1 family membrane protein insertase
MEKRVIAFLVLSVLVIVGYNFFLDQMGWLSQSEVVTVSPTAEPSTANSPTPASTRGSASQNPGLATEVPPVGHLPSEGSGDAGSGAAAQAEETIEVSTDLYRAVLTNHGADIKSWELKRYTTSPTEEGKPIQLVHQEGKFRRPLGVTVSDVAVSKALTDGLYKVERDFTTLNANHPTGHVTFSYQLPDRPIRLEKQMTFHYNSYLVDIAIKAEGVTGPVDVGLGTNFGVVDWGEGFIGLLGPAVMVDEKLVREMPDAEQEHKGAIRWVGLQDKYFISVLIPKGATSAVVKKEGEKLASVGARFAVPAEGAALSLQLYAGPKEFDTLLALNVGLEDAIDFGWFIYGSWDVVRAVAKPLFSVLRFINDFTHNYGIAIVLLTMSLKLLFVPLQYKSYKSMKQMQTVQPKVVALQQKYKDDRDRLNKELIKLYRDHKVNPVGGCLPMLLQTPVFVALFNILYMTIDLRHAPFLLWINDLSVQDPYYVLPVIMGVSMIVQQKIMPTTMDPTQAKIMLILPAFMTLLFLTFPAGLVLYWLTNNVLTITQQVVTDRYIFNQSTFASAISVEDATENDGQRSKKK